MNKNDFFVGVTCVAGAVAMPCLTFILVGLSADVGPSDYIISSVFAVILFVSGLAYLIDHRRDLLKLNGDAVKYKAFMEGWIDNMLQLRRKSTSSDVPELIREIDVLDDLTQRYFEEIEYDRVASSQMLERFDDLIRALQPFGDLLDGHDEADVERARTEARLLTSLLEKSLRNDKRRSSVLDSSGGAA